jgi:hypothetical protein
MALRGGRSRVELAGHGRHAMKPSIAAISHPTVHCCSRDLGDYAE